MVSSDVKEIQIGFLLECQIEGKVFAIPSFAPPLLSRELYIKMPCDQVEDCGVFFFFRCLLASGQQNVSCLVLH